MMNIISEQSHLYQVLENGFEVFELAVMEGINAFLALFPIQPMFSRAHS